MSSKQFIHDLRKDEEINEIILDKNSECKSIYSKESYKTCNLENFEMMYKLGQGSFGTVYLVKNQVNIQKNLKQK